MGFYSRHNVGLPTLTLMVLRLLWPSFSRFLADKTNPKQIKKKPQSEYVKDKSKAIGKTASLVLTSSLLHVSAPTSINYSNIPDLKEGPVKTSLLFCSWHRWVVTLKFPVQSFVTAPSSWAPSQLSHFFFTLVRQFVTFSVYVSICS